MKLRIIVLRANSKYVANHIFKAYKNTELGDVCITISSPGWPKSKPAVKKF